MSKFTLFRESIGYFATSTIKAHSAGVTGIALNPTLDYLVSVSSDSTWAFHDIETGKTLTRIESNEVQNGEFSLQLR